MVYGVIERRKVKVMEKKEQKHLYADTVEQNKRANHFLAIGYIVFYLCVLCVVGIACLRGIRTVGYTVMIAVLIILATAGTLVLYQRRKDDPKIRYIATVGLLVITFVMGWAFDNYYVRFMAAIPLVACILFYDKKFAAFSGIAVSAVNLLVTASKTLALHTYQGENGLSDSIRGVPVQPRYDWQPDRKGSSTAPDGGRYHCGCRSGAQGNRECDEYCQ